MLNLSNNDKILIVRLTALGDCLHTLPIVSAIKKIYPDVFIGWAVSEKCKDVVLNNPLIDKVHLISKNDKCAYWKEISNIGKEHYTISIDSQELLKSGIVSFLSGAKYRLAHNKSREFSYLFANEHLKDVPIFDLSRHVIERNMDFVRYLGIHDYDINFPLPENSLDNLNFVKNLLSNVDINKKTVVISPSTTWITKFWTKENWSKVIEHLQDKFNIIITGSKDDIKYVDDILASVENKNIVNITGKTNILQLKIVFENTDVVITPDSGSAHLAAAVVKPTVITLCGSTSSIRNGAYGINNINLSADLSCQPCYKKSCKYSEGTSVCMMSISPDAVVEKVFECLKYE